MTANDYDHVHYFEGKWWFWDETEAERMGPYDNEEAARNGLLDYAKWLDECETRRLNE